ncbi:hypothetical protein ACTMS2_19665 [Micromonospora sp. SD12]
MTLVLDAAGVGWKEPWRDLLLGLHRHQDADVHEEAYDIDMS